MRSVNGSDMLIHGVFLEVSGIGVLLCGASGIGKSELALELVTRGHSLIADDAVEFELDSSGLVIGSCPEMLKGFLHVRGLGLINVVKMFGPGSACDRMVLDLILRMVPVEAVIESEWLDGCRASRTVLGRWVSERLIPVGPGRSLATLAEVACRDHVLRRRGYDAAADLSLRQKRAIGVPE